MADALSFISLISFIVAGACLLLAVIFWFAFRIPKVIGDLTGRTARKSIAGMRTKNEAAGSKVSRQCGGYPAQGGSAGNIPNSRKMGLHETEPLEGDITEEIEMGVLSRNAGVEDDEDATVSLDGSDDTKPLSKIASSAGKEAGKRLIMLEEIVLINTDEVIE